MANLLVLLNYRIDDKVEKPTQEGIVLSRKLNDAISGRVFYADFGTPQGNQSL